MKYLIAATAALFTSSAFAHPGHLAKVDGHAHSLSDLAIMGLVPVLAGVALIGFGVWAMRFRND